MGIYIGFKEDTEPKIFNSETKPTQETHPQFDFTHGPFGSNEQANRFIRAMMSTTYKKHHPKEAPDDQDVRVAVRVSAYTIVIFLVSIYVLVNIWPATTGDLTLNMTRAVTLSGIGIIFSIGPETTLLFAIMFSGIVGACTYSFFAISYHLGGKNNFDKVWEAWYVLRPILGAGLALIIYLLLRGGVLTIGANLNNLNLVGVAGISGLAGMFSEQAMRMLRELAVTAFGEARKDKNKGPGKDKNG